jgi:hypothetical protein
VVVDDVVVLGDVVTHPVNRREVANNIRNNFLRTSFIRVSSLLRLKGCVLIYY